MTILIWLCDAVGTMIGARAFGLNLTLRSRAFFNSLRAAYPAVSFQWRRIWGAYFAAVGDVTTLGSLPVPFHLRNAPDRRMKTHGIGVGYRYPPDFEGSDIAQQYLPEALADRTYYLPGEQGYLNWKLVRSWPKVGLKITFSRSIALETKVATVRLP